MDRGSVEAVVVRVAGGRAKRRKLAQALTQRPAILTDGRSPAPPGRRGSAHRVGRWRGRDDFAAAVR